MVAFLAHDSTVLLFRQKMVPLDRFELPTHGVETRRSSAELQRRAQEEIRTPYLFVRSEALFRMSYKGVRWGGLEPPAIHLRAS